MIRNIVRCGVDHCARVWHRRQNQRLRRRAARERDEQTWATITFQDTGPGISPHDRAHIFERFYRGEAGRKSGAPGTGLGLAISSQIMNKLGGSITLDSRSGEGAAFTVWLKPAAQEKPVGNLLYRKASMIPIVSIVGKSDAGKTTLIEKLIPELKRRGYRVATIKHDAHRFDIDHPGKDSYRHFQAGADWTIIGSPDKLASVRRLDRELTLDEIAAQISGVDLILTEGYKREARRRIEVSRRSHATELISQPEELFAIAADHPIELGVPVYDLNDAAGLVDLIEREVLKK